MGNAVKIAAKADMVIIADEVQHVVDVLIYAFYAGIAPVFFKKLSCKGNAGKEDVIAAVRARGHAPVDDNEADALALLHWAIETQEV